MVMMGATSDYGHQTYRKDDYQQLFHDSSFFSKVGIILTTQAE
jgi:hypothetical protein